MILNKFRDKNIKKKIDKELTNSERVLISISDEKINSILIFADETTVNNYDQIVAKELGVDISKIEIVNYIKKAPKELDSDEFLIEKDFNWLGKIKNERVLKLANLEFDLLINLTTNNLLLDYLTVFSRAKFKVGFSSADNRLYDFMITVNNKDITVFSRELKKYLKILNKI